jgi:hypothetical protein
MYEITSPYYKKFDNVKTIYYKFSNNIVEDYILENDILLIKGNETQVPGIIDKTIKAFEYIKNNYNNYDYLVRSSISTIINFDLLINILLQNNIDYGSGLMFNLQWLDAFSGIIDDTYFNTIYASGTSIILSKSLMNKILDNKEFINYNLVDDLSIGVIIRQKFTETIYYQISGFIEVIPENLHNLDINNLIFYRNKNFPRYQDINHMKHIISLI